MDKGWIKLYLSRRPLLMGSEERYDEADFAAFGVPFDATESFRPGSRFAPIEIRRYSENMEFRGLERIRLADLGDIPRTVNTGSMLRMVSRIVGEIRDSGKTPIILGGEHTLTLASGLRLCKEGSALIILDAHLDVWEEFMDTKINHATWLRRLIEKVDEVKAMIIGVREEPEHLASYADEKDLTIIRSEEIMDKPQKAFDKINNFIQGCRKIYLSIDMDVLDPIYAPGVGNPEPCGISPRILRKIVEIVCDAELSGLDVVEANPLFDDGRTSLHAAYTIYSVFSRVSKRA